MQEVRELLNRTGESVEKVRALVRGEYSELHVGHRFPTMEILPPALAAFQKAMPGVKVLLNELSSDELIIEVEARHSVGLCPIASGKRLLYRPLTGPDRTAARRHRPSHKG